MSIFSAGQLLKIKCYGLKVGLFDPEIKFKKSIFMYTKQKKTNYHLGSSILSNSPQFCWNQIYKFALNENIKISKNNAMGKVRNEHDGCDD